MRKRISSRRPESPVRTGAWLAAFAGIAFLTLMTISYQEGHIDESGRQNREVAGQIAELQAQKEFLQAKYDLLADSAGEGAILEAGIRLQERQEARK